MHLRDMKHLYLLAKHMEINTKNFLKDKRVMNQLLGLMTNFCKLKLVHVHVEIFELANKSTLK